MRYVTYLSTLLLALAVTLCWTVAPLAAAPGPNPPQKDDQVVLAAHNPATTQAVVLASARYDRSWRRGDHRGPPYGHAYGYDRGRHHVRQPRHVCDYSCRAIERHKMIYYGPRYNRYGGGPGWNMRSCINDRHGSFCFNLWD